MKFTTHFEIETIKKPLDHHGSVVLMGSCFSQNIGDKLSYCGFEALVNPFGVIFNPYSLMLLMEKSIDEDFTMDDVSGNFSYLAHSDLNAANASEVLIQLQDAGQVLKKRLEKASHVIITLGTAWIYELQKTGQIVANCHQQPQKLFSKRLLSRHEMEEALRRIESLIKKVNPATQLIYTLSPVRHTKDGMVENARSKARLHEAIQQSCDGRVPYYFPAYEILMDELRDYRFYASDMIHPNATAVDYVWLRFRESVLHQNTVNAIKTIEKHQKLAGHKPKDIEAHALQVEQSRQQLLSQFPYLQL
ncbi:hypothetical protein AAU57_07045 [Nonlabens sp. YIK11]|uniref:GSCFA domain-containing protein n=1 Tax=Nonlabens sp. YIK11 TaxID=1453349 RepID=UPI0006DD2C46|nr:GSCFA domain-containing protein [Nonlabens sp. YIK11]KQC33099.1 hypothetical protein AAU57_07045 [Nonlabens sp. YIK11]